MGYNSLERNNQLYKEYINSVLKGIYYKELKEKFEFYKELICVCRHCIYFIQEKDPSKITSLPQYASGFCKKGMWLNRWIGDPSVVHKEIKHISEYTEDEYCEKIGDVIEVVKLINGSSYKRHREYGVPSDGKCGKFKLDIKRWDGIYHPVFDCRMTAKELGKLLSLSATTIHKYARNGMKYREEYIQNEGWANPSYLYRYFELTEIIPWLKKNKPKYVEIVEEYLNKRKKEYEEILKKYNAFISSVK